MNGIPRLAPIADPTEPLGSGLMGQFVDLDGQVFYRISEYEEMPPFLMSIPSETDLWMFLASGGGLAAGRVDANGSLFPYETVDRLHNGHHYTGPVTVILVETGDAGETFRWEPFSGTGAEDPAVVRAIYKNTTGNQVVFEERHHELGLRFRYRWAACDDLGWVRTATLSNVGEHTRELRVLDGLRNLLPHGAPLALYQQASNLVDAYKKSEIDDSSGLGIFSLTSAISDRAEAGEMLRANVVWSVGLENPRYHLSLGTLADFRAGRVVSGERELNGTRGNYFVSSRLAIEPGATERWHLIADSSLDQIGIAELRRRICDGVVNDATIESLIEKATGDLRRNVGSADGIQLTGRAEAWAHHFANVLFNNMRGGVFFQNYEIPLEDFVSFLETRNCAVAERHRKRLGSGITDVETLLATARERDDADLERLAYEYLPLYFSRRHGDPSRPWNHFSISSRTPDGELELRFQGNWRDIFQNWEALGTSFPGFLPGMIAKFVNASTIDGFNPYRITREGVDWEIPAPDDPWSNIGYWGDHQIIYLLKLLEALDRHEPGALDALLDREIFSYAEVPYRIRPYQDILTDQCSTIDFDAELESRIEKRVETGGTDGRLMQGSEGTPYRVNLFEKLMVPVLSKLSNLVPGGGIWMNTQRPEWNDANNALAGGGVSVVTLGYLRRHLAFLADRLDSATERTLPVSTEVAEWFAALETIFEDGRDSAQQSEVSPEERRRVMDALGQAFSIYRAKVYDRGFSGRVELSVRRVTALWRTALEFVDADIERNRRPDGLFHTYNRLDASSNGMELIRLPIMLEGQVAVLSSGFLDPAASVDLVQGLFASELYHEGHRSFLLYPERELPGFMDRNVVPESRAREIGLLAELLDRGENPLVAIDVEGICRFGGDIGAAEDVSRRLDDLGAQPDLAAAVQRDRAAVMELFDEVFDHSSYTGRSGTMYAYEGLGCVYWHMVAKLLLAVQETYAHATALGTPDEVRDALARCYFDVRSGIGYQKSAADYGAFPTDPYSHTPAAGGARQPGMTGQVKEEILTRAGELGVRVEKGAVHFRPTLLQRGELLEESAVYEYFDVTGECRRLELGPGMLAFTFCQVPVVYERTAGESWLQVELSDDSTRRMDTDGLDPELSASLFSRSGHIQRIRVGIRADELQAP